MQRIVIAEEGPTEGGFAANLSIDGRSAFAVTVTNPFQRKQEAELEWYYEGWPRQPLGTPTVGRRAARSIKHYGMWLFNQVFPYGRPRTEYALMRAKDGRIVLEVVGRSPEFLALHWEALQDPDVPLPLAMDWAIVRRLDRDGLGEVTPVPVTTPSPVLNLLVVTCRPASDGGDGAWILTQTLAQAVGASRVGVNMELLRPGTFEALSKRLESRGPDYYQVVHFDCPWVVMDYATVLASGVKLQGRYGRRDLVGAEFEGERAFLCLECGNSVDLVETGELGELVVPMRVPVCVLYAHQGVQSPGHRGETLLLARQLDTITIVGADLMAAGLPLAVGFGYAVTPQAVRLFLETLFRQLVLQQPVLEALLLGRLEMYADKARAVCHGATLELEDWMVPVVFANRVEDLLLCGPEAGLQQEAAPVPERAGTEFGAPAYGFVGRELEVLKVENALLRHNVLLVMGPGGVGKTTLLSHLAGWWRTTHFAFDVFYFGYDTRPWTLLQMMSEMIWRIYGESGHLEFGAMEPEAQFEMVASALLCDDYVLMLDGFEAVTGEGLPVEGVLAAEEQAKIFSFLEALVGGRTKVVLGSRNREKWLGAVVGKNVFHLRGLDRASRSVLAQRVLEAHVADGAQVARFHEDPYFRQLDDVLAGYPLAMEVVLANLAHQSPLAILRDLAADHLQPGVRLEPVTLSVLCCVDYSHRVTSERTRQLLVCLAPFEGFVAFNFLHLYVDELKKQPAFRDADLSGLDEAVRDAISWGLLSPRAPLEDDGKLEGLVVLPGFPFFLKAMLRQQDGGRQRALREAFKNHYRVLGRKYEEMMAAKDKGVAAEAVEVVGLEVDNLARALRMCLKDRQNPDMFDCLQEYYRLQKEYWVGLDLAKYVLEAQEPCPYEKPRPHAIVRVLNVEDWIARWHVELGEYAKARGVYVGMRARVQGMGVSYEEKKGFLSSVYNNLGKVCQDLRKFDEARQYYEESLKIDLEFEDVTAQARTYHNLGIIAETLRDFPAARRHDQRALELLKKVGDRHGRARVYAQLGNVAKEVRDFEKAYRHYLQAMEMFVELGDVFFQGKTFHQLGLVAGQMGKLDKARGHYLRALDIFTDHNDALCLAKTNAQLGNLSGESRDFDDAKRRYVRALELFVAVGDLESQEKTYHSLGMVAQHLKKYDEAREHYQMALDVTSGLEDRHLHARTYRRLGDVAYELREYGEARWSYLQAMEISEQFDDRYEQGNVHCALGKLDRTLEDFKGARGHLEKSLAIFLDFDDERMAGIATRWLEDLKALDTTPGTGSWSMNSSGKPRRSRDFHKGPPQKPVGRRSSTQSVASSHKVTSGHKAMEQEQGGNEGERAGERTAERAGEQAGQQEGDDAKGRGDESSPMLWDTRQKSWCCRPFDCISRCIFK